MHPIKQSASIQHLDSYQQENPAEVLEYFTTAWDVAESRRLVGELLHTALTTRNTPFKKPRHRARAARFAEDLQATLEALHLWLDREGKNPLSLRG